MLTIDQKRQQITVMVNTLQASLERILSFNTNAEVEKAILLHCGMILFYQRLDALLVSPELIELVNENAHVLLNEQRCNKVFNPLNCDHTLIEDQKLIFMVQFSAIIVPELKEILNEKLNNAVRMTLEISDRHSSRSLLIMRLWSMLLAIQVLMYLSIDLSLIALSPFVIQVLFVAAAIIILGMMVSLIKSLFEWRESSKIKAVVQSVLEIFKKLDSVEGGITDGPIDKAKIYPKNSDIVPDLKGRKFSEINCSFFKLSKPFAVSQKDFDVANPWSLDKP